jgi:cell division septation protein DedD
MAKKQSTKKKAYIELTRKGFWLWLFIIILVSGWMFTLGVLVGRGTAPVDFDIEKLQKELLALKQAVVRKELQKIASESEAGLKKSDLGFYEKLKEPDSKEPPMIAKPAPKKRPSPKPKPVKAQTKKTVRPTEQTSRTTTTSASSAKEVASKGLYTIQVASIKDVRAAERLVAKLKKKGYPAYQVKAEIPNKGLWYRVRVGSYAKREAAEPILKRLKNDNQNGFIVSP